jgi:hypothetical protein
MDRMRASRTKTAVVAALLAALGVGAWLALREKSHPDGDASSSERSRDVVPAPQPTLAARPVGPEPGCEPAPEVVVPAPSEPPPIDRWTRGDERLHAHVRVGESGGLSLRTATKGVDRWTDPLEARFAGAPPADVVKALHAVLAELRRRVDDPTMRLPEGISDARLVLDVEAGVGWQYVQWLMQVGANPHVRIARVTLVSPDGGDAIAVDLPRDSGPPVDPSSEPPPEAAPSADPPPVLRVKLFRKTPRPDAAFTRIRVMGDGVPAPVAVDLDPEGSWGWSLVEESIRRAAETSPDVRAEVAAPPPTGGSVPYRDVYEVLRRLRAAGIQDIRFEGAMPPLLAESPR